MPTPTGSALRTNPPEASGRIDEAPWACDVETLLARLRTDAVSGLSSSQAAQRLAADGPNELAEARPPGLLALVVRQFANTMTMVLGAAAAITIAIGELQDTAVIAVIAVLNASVGFVQERRAEQAIAALKAMASGTATVVRDGSVQEVPAAELVTGDVLGLVAGDVVPADTRLVESHALRVNQAALTGESEPSAKGTGIVAADAMVADQLNMAFRGTAVTYGRGGGVVVATGMGTEVGRIASMLEAHRAPPTPLQRSLASLGRWTAMAALAVCALVFVTGVVRGEPMQEMLLTSVSLAVAAVPEGLPAIVTVSLAIGARRMAERNAVIRRLPAVETLGSVSVICSDKTGTLTQNRMVVEKVWTPGGRYTVDGDGYRPSGCLHPDGAGDPSLRRVGLVAAACNDAFLHGPAVSGGEWTVTGDPTDGALAVLASKLGAERSDVDAAFPRVGEIALDAERRRMTTLHRDGDGWWVAVKGALVALAPLLEERCDEAERAAAEFADAGYRVLALGERHVGSRAAGGSLESLERSLRLVGIVAIADPARPEAADAVAMCKAAGIVPVMITGDDPRTARRIAASLGVVDGDVRTLTGVELDRLGDEALSDAVGRVRVFARTMPEQKLRIVDAWRARGAVVAMTGDGVNDAPALQRADIGVAMGRIGTDVSKEAADMVLADDNFATIVHAVEEGRRIYDNIRRCVRYLLTTNAGEILVMLLAIAIGLPVPLAALQILWINLVTDGLPAIGLGLEPAEPGTMRRPPRRGDESILGGGLWQHAVLVGLLMAAVALGVQAGARAAGWPWQTMVFTTLALLQLGHALAVRSETESFFAIGLATNRWVTWAAALGLAAQMAVVYLPVLQGPFDTQPLGVVQLAVVLAASSAAFVAVEIEKAVRRRRVSR